MRRVEGIDTPLGELTPTGLEPWCSRQSRPGHASRSTSRTQIAESSDVRAVASASAHAAGRRVSPSVLSEKLRPSAISSSVNGRAAATNAPADQVERRIVLDHRCLAQHPEQQSHRRTTQMRSRDARPAPSSGPPTRRRTPAHAPASRRPATRFRSHPRTEEAEHQLEEAPLALLAQARARREHAASELIDRRPRPAPRTSRAASYDPPRRDLPRGSGQAPGCFSTAGATSVVETLDYRSQRGTSTP